MDRRLRPEVVELLKEQFPAGCLIEIVKTNVADSTLVGKRATVVIPYGEDGLIGLKFHDRVRYKDMIHRYTYGLTIIKRVP